MSKILHSADWQYSKNKNDAFMYAKERYLEYASNINDPELVQVIAGDIFHNIGMNATIDEFLAVKDLLKQMQNISPLIIVGGNHDNQKNNALNENDNLYKVVKHFNLKNTTYLKHSIIFEKYNYRFFNYSIYELSLPPKNHKQYIDDEKYNIGIYHDPLDFAVDFNGKKFPKAQNTIIFEGLDCVMMGDIHQRQHCEYEPNRYAVFSGSPYQTRASETINGKGFVEWDFSQNGITFKYIDIENPYNIAVADYDSSIKQLKIKNKI